MGDELWTQVRVSFAGSLVEVAHLRPGHSFTLGENPEADLVYALPGLHRLVIATATGAVVERPTTGELESVGAGESTLVELGSLRIEIVCEAGLAPVLDRRPVDRSLWLSIAGSALALVPLLVFALIAAQAQLPPLESDPDMAMVYMARSSARVEEPERDPRRPPLPEPEPKHDTREAERTSAPVWTPPRNRELEDETEAEAEVDPSADWPGTLDMLAVARAQGSGPRAVEPMLQRHTSPVDEARKAGIAGALPSDEEIDEFVAVAASAFGSDVDDTELWAAMTEGPIDTTIGGLELTASARSGGGTATGVIRSGAPERPTTPVKAEALRPTLAGPAPLRARLLSTEVQGELERDQVQRFAKGLANEWVECVEGKGPIEFELRYTVRRNGKVSGVEIPRAQLPAKARRCVIAAVEASAGLETKGRSAKVEQRVAIRRRR